MDFSRLRDHGGAGFYLPMDKLQIVQVNISELIPSEYNPREATDKDYQDLKNSIEHFGLVDPIIVNSAPNRKNIVIGGHFRLRVAKDLGFIQAPVIYINIPDIEKEKELNLRLNKNIGRWNFDLLANLDEKFLEGVGFSESELAGIFQLDDEIPTLEDVILEEAYEPNWLVIRFDDRKREQILKAIEPLLHEQGVKVDIAKD